MIDILMATYNGDKYLREQIDSILRQSNADWRLIIRDDCSIDNTVAIIQEYKVQYPDKFVLMQADTPSGSAQNNFFKLIEYWKDNCNADYVMFADQDDVWLPNKIQVTLDKMKQIEQRYTAEIPVLIHTELAVVDEQLKVLNTSLFDMHNMDANRNKLNNILVQNIVTGCTMMVNKSLLNMMTEIPQYAVMHDMWIALIASAFGQIGFVDKPTMLYRQHGRNVKGARNMKSVVYTLQKFKQTKEIHIGLVEQYKQADDFLRIYKLQLNAQDQKILQHYASLEQSNVLRKAIVLTKYKLYKKGIVRKLGQILL